MTYWIATYLLAGLALPSLIALGAAWREMRQAGRLPTCRMTAMLLALVLFWPLSATRFMNYFFNQPKGTDHDQA